MIARLTVTRGATKEYPIAERVRGGWQNGATFYPDDDVTDSIELHVSRSGGYEAEARMTLESAYVIVLPHESEVAQYQGLLLEAQVQATLALVEQQRIANLIAYAAKWTDDEVTDVDDEIRGALGR